VEKRGVERESGDWQGEAVEGHRGGQERGLYSREKGFPDREGGEEEGYPVGPWGRGGEGRRGIRRREVESWRRGGG